MQKDFYTFATGRVRVFSSASRKAVEIIGKQDGFLGVHIELRTSNCVWFFDTLNNAKKARNVCEANNIKISKHILYGHYGADGTPCIDDVEL